MSAISPEVLFTASWSPEGEKQADEGWANGWARTTFFRDLRFQIAASRPSVASVCESAENASE